MFLANENFPRPSVLMLRAKGFAVKSIQEKFPGISDEEVLQMAISEELIILTFDSDYGELIFKYAKANPPAVIFFREKSNTPDFAGRMLLSLLEQKTYSFTNAFTVIEANSIRQRFYKK